MKKNGEFYFGILLIVLSIILLVGTILREEIHNWNSTGVCPIILHTQEIGDISCDQEVNHSGPHISTDGTIWTYKAKGESK